MQTTERGSPYCDFYAWACVCFECGGPAVHNKFNAVTCQMALSSS